MLPWDLEKMFGLWGGGVGRDGGKERKECGQ